MNVNNNITINIALDKNKQLTVNAQGVILPDAIQLCLAAIEAMCKTTLARAESEELKKSLEEDMYEMINLGASSLLSKMFPDIEMRPDVTVDALMKAENELVAEKGEEYAKAYAESAQAEKDVYEHNVAKANLLKENMNRAQKRKAAKLK